ncbi:amino acid permease [Deltaproteobacteria bacterium PRO3]|nr:amino acid permease [Deltaproteobacteria bacterium PRO3]
MTNPPSFRLSGGLSPSLLRRPAETDAAPSAVEPRELVARIQSHFGATLSPSVRMELNGLAAESDAGLFYEGLLGLAGREERDDRLEFASAIYSAAAEAAPSAPLRERAQARLDAIVGRGAVGNRAEFLLRRLARDASHPSMLVGMAGAQAVFGLSRMAFLSRLAASPTTNFFTRGFGARALASTGAFMLEAPSFVAFTRGANAALGQEQDWRLATLGREVAGSFITLGALKTAGALSTGAFNRLHGINPLTGQATRLTGLSAISQRVLPQAAMFGGIVLGHSLETRLGIREHVDGATTMVDSLAMLLQFHVGGRLMHHAMPGVAAFNHELNVRSELVARTPRPTPEISSDGVGSLLQPALAVAGGPRSALPGREAFEPRLPDRVFMTANGEGNGNGGNGNSLPPPPPSSGSGSFPPGGRRSNLLSSAIRNIQAFGGKFNLNAAMDVDAPLRNLPTMPPARPVRSVQEGIRRAQALGHNRRSAAFLRWGAHQLRSNPELQGRFLDLMQQVFEFQARQREALDPVLRGLPEADFAELNRLSAEYTQALERMTGNSGRHFGEAMLLRQLTRGWESADVIRALSDATLREAGIEPEARHAVARNPHSFEKGEILAILEHPALRDLPETARLRTAVETFHEKLAEIRRNLGPVKTETATLRQEIADTENIEVRQAHEKRIKELSQSINYPYARATLTLQRAMREFMADEVRSRAFLIETARRSSLVRGLQEADSTMLARHVRENLSRLTGEARTAAESYLGNYEQLASVEGRSGLRRSFYSALRVFGLDPMPPLEVRGRYERALLDLLQKAPHEFWEFGPYEVRQMDQAAQAQTDYYRALHENTSRLREGYAAVEKANDAFWERYDREANGLYIEDLNLQLMQATHMYERLRAPVQEARFRELRDAASEAIQRFTDPSTRGANSRETNRSLEVALKKIAEFRAFVRAELRAENHPEADFRAVSPLMLPFVDKIDSSKRTRWTESLGAGWPVLWRTFFRSMGLFSSLERNESSSVLDRHFLNWGSGITRATRSRLVVDPRVDRLVEAEPVVAAGNHNSWLDFLYGGTPVARAAQLQGRGTSRDAMRIGAKEGLGKMIGPVIERAIEMLTEPVADSAPEYDGSVTNLSRAMAFGILMITLIYVLINVAYLYVMPIDDMLRALGRDQNNIAAVVVVNHLFGNGGALIVSAMILISTFGCTNATSLVSARIYYAMAREGWFFPQVASTHGRYRTPHLSLIYQCVWACLLTFSGSFDLLTDLVIIAAFVFYGLVVFGVLVLRRKQPSAPRPYRAFGYPAVPLLFTLFCLVLLAVTLVESPGKSAAGLTLILSGLPFYYLWNKKRKQRPTATMAAH